MVLKINKTVTGGIVMKKWNDSFGSQRKVGDTTITIGQQSFFDGTVLVKEADGNVLSLPMYSDESGNFYFEYNGCGIYISNYLGNFPL